MVNFTSCKAAFLNNATNLDLYSYRGPVSSLEPDKHDYITLAGCRTLCGSGSDFYPWSISSDTILTWVLPMLVMFLLAPFEPNKNGNTVLAAVRWAGSPAMSLWYILSSIRVNARLAEMVDMAVGYDNLPEKGSDYSQLRDAFVILSGMNQYELDESITSDDARCKSAEVVIRAALFSDMLLPDQNAPLLELRTRVAATFRASRRRSIVPMLLGLVWFLFILGLSINFTFNRLGENAAAHSLALGFAISWITPLVIAAVMDRDLTAIRDLREDINPWFRSVCDALRLDENRLSLCQQAGPFGSSIQMALDRDMLDQLPDAFFAQSAGQGRLRWHRGIAGPILAGIEKSHAAQYGRGWLLDQPQARYALLGPEGCGLASLDRSLLWQAGAAFAIVYGNIAAGFLISYFTPTIGLGCRAGGYMIFAVLTLSAALGEVVIDVWCTLDSRLRRIGHRILTALELVNLAWLIWMTIAQTFGIYQTCSCLSSVWAPGGGYIQFDDVNEDDAPSVVIVWAVGTGLAGAILCLSLLYLVTQWCQQSHLSTADYASAQRGLMRTRRCKRGWGWVTAAPHAIGRGISRLLSLLGWATRTPSRIVWSAEPLRRSRRASGDYQKFDA